MKWVRMTQRQQSSASGAFRPKPIWAPRKGRAMLVEAIKKSANVALLAKHAISYVDRTFIASHDDPPRECIFRLSPRSTFHER
jgi:hypothetical protein